MPAPTLACPTCKSPTTPDSKSCSACGQRVAHVPVLTAETIELVVYGEPISQGSMRSPRPGVVIPDNPKLNPWRNKVTATARQALGPGWEPWDSALGIDLVFTLPRPKSAPKTKVTFPQTRPDLDKLLRAIGDALSPRRGFKTITEDSRIVEVGQLAKTFPAPMNTHPGALDEPGVRIRLRRLEWAGK